MALNKLSYSVDNLDKAKDIIHSNMHLMPKDFPEQFRLVSDHHWGEKITLANKIIDQLNTPDELK